MKKALISPIQNNKVVQIEPSDKIFEVAQPLFWVDCPDTITTEWSYNGTTFVEPAITPVKVPQSVTRAQARKALAIQGLFNSVQPAIDSIQDPLQRQLAQIDWDDSLTYERNNATLAMLAAGLGLTEQQLDELFILAAQQP